MFAANNVPNLTAGFNDVTFNTNSRRFYLYCFQRLSNEQLRVGNCQAGPSSAYVKSEHFCARIYQLDLPHPRSHFFVSQVLYHNRNN